MSRGWRFEDVPDLAGKTALVTGANAGLGLEISRALARRRATVLLACRNAEKAQRAIDEIRAETADAQVTHVPLDLADLASVAAAAATVQEQHGRLHLLLNNAGLMALDESRTVDGFEMQFGVNHLGHFALTLDLLPLLAATDGARVVTQASMGHRAGKLAIDDLMFERRGYDRWRPYFQSKLANILFASELDRRLSQAGVGVRSLSAHPGASRTDLGTEGRGLTNRAMRTIVPLTTQPASIGAIPMLRAATDPDANGGAFYGPRWIVRGAAVTETPSRRARNTASAEALWDASERLTGRSLRDVLAALPSTV